MMVKSALVVFALEVDQLSAIYLIFQHTEKAVNGAKVCVNLVEEKIGKV